MSLDSSSSNALVSVVIPVKNRFDLLKEALDSVATQVSVLEVLIIDDSTEDGLQLLCDQYKNLRIQIHSNAGKGISGARNTGLRMAKGEYVAFLDSDDIWKSAFIAISLNHLNRNPKFSGTLAFSEVFFDGTLGFESRLKINFLNFIKKIFLQGMYLFNGGALLVDSPFLMQISHAVFRRKNLPTFREDMKSSEDWIFAFETQLLNGPLRIIPIKLLRMRYSAKSSSFALAKKNRTREI
ncbi:MAG: glycosyltransferase [Bdellovibrionales bacterium]|nr:glycosyltransferase [Bdellovibrionales bacterium]